MATTTKNARKSAKPAKAKPSAVVVNDNRDLKEAMARRLTAALHGRGRVTYEPDMCLRTRSDESTNDAGSLDNLFTFTPSQFDIDLSPVLDWREGDIDAQLVNALHTLAWSYSCLAQDVQENLFEITPRAVKAVA